MDTRMHVVDSVGGLREQRLKFLEGFGVILANIVAIGAGALGVDVDDPELDQE